MVPAHPDYLFINMDDLRHGSNRENIKPEVESAENYFFYEGDISLIRDVGKIFSAYNITDVFHFAAETHVDRSSDQSALFISTNVIGTENLLKVFTGHNCEGTFMHISTDEVYGEVVPGEISWTEYSPIEPRNIYSATKAAAEHLVRAYGNVKGLKYIITRAGNNYGPNQDDSKLVPKMIKKALANEPIELYGDGSNFRQWTYVMDHVWGIWACFERGERGEAYNIASGDIMTNNDVVKKIIEVTKSSSPIVYITDRPGHDIGYSMNCTKLLEHTGYACVVDFETGLENTITP